MQRRGGGVGGLPEVGSGRGGQDTDKAILLVPSRRPLIKGSTLVCPETPQVSGLQEQPHDP